MPQTYKERTNKKIAKNLWLTPEVKEMLTALAMHRGTNETDTIAELIEASYKQIR